MVDPDKYIEKITAEINKLRQEILELMEIKKRFPDVKVHINRWDIVKFCAESVNPIANDCLIMHACGSCCPDSPLVITPILKQDSFPTVYGSPQICIGEQCGDGDILDFGWEKTLKEKNISDAVIEKIRKYEELNRPDNGDDDYDD
jgi:hypothetical protein